MSFAVVFVLTFKAALMALLKSTCYNYISFGQQKQNNQDRIQ